MTFPVTRLRRLRYNGVLRQMVTETKLSVDDFVMPLFVISGTNVRNHINSMPGEGIKIVKKPPFIYSEIC